MNNSSLTSACSSFRGMQASETVAEQLYHLKQQLGVTFLGPVDEVCGISCSMYRKCRATLETYATALLNQ
jgi:hypothetical protein